MRKLLWWLIPVLAIMGLWALMVVAEMHTYAFEKKCKQAGGQVLSQDNHRGCFRLERIPIR